MEFESISVLLSTSECKALCFHVLCALISIIPMFSSAFRTWMYLTIETHPFSVLAVAMFGAAAWASTARNIAKGATSTTLEASGRARGTALGKVAVVTGASSGIGKVCAHKLALEGAKVIIACRSVSSAEKTKRDILKESPRIQTEQLIPMELDLASFQSIRSFAKSFEDLELPLHILLNNAGVMMCPFQLTQDGIEMQFGTNHIGHFLLTNLLLPTMQKKTNGNCRIVNVASLGHVFATHGINYGEISDPNTYDKMQAYAMSKLANILHAAELNRRQRIEGFSHISAYSLHPGTICTQLTRHLLPTSISDFIRPLSLLVLKTVEEGAQTSLFCCLDRNAVPGVYHSDCKVGLATKTARSERAAAELWRLSERMTEK